MLSQNQLEAADIVNHINRLIALSGIYGRNTLDIVWEQLANQPTHNLEVYELAFYQKVLDLISEQRKHAANY